MALYFFADLAGNFQNNLKKLFSFIKKYYDHAIRYKAFSYSKFDQRDHKYSCTHSVYFRIINKSYLPQG